MPGKRVALGDPANFAQTASNRLASCLSVGGYDTSLLNSWHSARAHPPAVQTTDLGVRASIPVCHSESILSRPINDSDSVAPALKN